NNLVLLSSTRPPAERRKSSHFGSNDAAGAEFIVEIATFLVPIHHHALRLTPWGGRRATCDSRSNACSLSQSRNERGHDVVFPSRTSDTDQAGRPCPMPNFTATRLELCDVLLISPKRFPDGRGYFMEAYNTAQFATLGIDATFVQDNQAFSAERGTVRGLHFQRPPKAQAKLVRVLRGSIFDVAVDLRRGSQ